MIENLLIEKLSDSNVCNFANAAVKFNANNLEEHCNCYIIDAIKESKVLENVQNLNTSVKAEVFDRMSIYSSNSVLVSP